MFIRRLSKANLVALFVLGALALCACQREVWTATVYPDKSNLSNFEVLGLYTSLAVRFQEVVHPVPAGRS